MRFLSILVVAASIASATAHNTHFAVRSAIRKSAAVSSRSSQFEIFKRQSLSQCNNACSSPGDASAAAGLSSCAPTDILCLCTYLAQITANCLACVAQAEDVTMGELQSGCAAATMSAPLDSVTVTDGSMTRTGTGSSSAATPSNTIGICETACSSASDTAAGGVIAACDSNDTECICTGSAQLSSGCLSCTLQVEQISPSEFASVCSEYSYSAFTSATRTNSGVVPPTSSGGTRTSSGSFTRSAGSSTASSTGSGTASGAGSSPSTTARGAAGRSGVESGLLGAAVVFVGIMVA